MTPPDQTEIRSFLKAVRDGDTPQVQRQLAGRPELANTRDPAEFDAIPLRHAVERGDREMVDALLDGGADINAKSVEGVPPVGCAAYRENSELVEFFQANGAQ